MGEPCRKLGPFCTTGSTKSWNNFVLLKTYPKCSISSSNKILGRKTISFQIVTLDVQKFYAVMVQCAIICWIIQVMIKEYTLIWKIELLSLVFCSQQVEKLQICNWNEILPLQIGKRGYGRVHFPLLHYRQYIVSHRQIEHNRPIWYVEMSATEWHCNDDEFREQSGE